MIKIMWYNCLGECNMNIELFFSAITKYLLGIILVSLLLFIPMFIAGIIMMIFNPSLLKSRLNAKEKEKEQKTVVLLSGLMFLIGFILAGLNYRLNWIHIPKIIVIISSLIFILSYLLYGEVLRENTFLSRTIEVKSNQKLIDKGLYGIIRHPMYLATIFLFLSMPLLLDSVISFIIFLVYPFIIIKRIKNEEQVLEKELHGYKEYKNKVKYRLIPFIW